MLTDPKICQQFAVFGRLWKKPLQMLPCIRMPSKPNRDLNECAAHPCTIRLVPQHLLESSKCRGVPTTHSQQRPYFKDLRAYMEQRPPAPEWLKVDMGAMKGVVEREPERRDVDIPLNVQLIVEYYSR